MGHRSAAALLDGRCCPGVMVPENWCCYIFKVGDEYYIFAALEETARSWEFEISK
jgi:hypothetical protein